LHPSQRSVSNSPPNLVFQKTLDFMSRVCVCVCVGIFIQNFFHLVGFLLLLHVVFGVESTAQ
jgi:uncharacterized membrane protein